MRRSVRSLRACTTAAIAGIAVLAISTAGASASTNSVTLTAGTLSLAAPANFTYPSTALTGSVITLALPTAFATTVTDGRGSGAGWHLLASIDVPLTSGSNTIPLADHTVTSATVSAISGTGPTNSITYPYVFPTTAASVFDAAALTGRGTSTETFATQLVIPADANAGTYTQVLTLSIVTGP